jgi:hypothetical protein
VTDKAQFRPIDPPFALADPVGPNRQLLFSAVLLLALGAGGAIAFGMNQLHPACFTRRAVRRVMGLPVLGAVSMLLTPAELVRRRMAAVAWVASYLLLFASTTIVMRFPTEIAGILRTLSGAAT